MDFHSPMKNTGSMTGSTTATRTARHVPPPHLQAGNSAALKAAITVASTRTVMEAIARAAMVASATSPAKVETL